MQFIQVRTLSDRRDMSRHDQALSFRVYQYNQLVLVELSEGIRTGPGWRRVSPEQAETYQPEWGDHPALQLIVQALYGHPSRVDFVEIAHRVIEVYTTDSRDWVATRIRSALRAAAA